MNLSLEQLGNSVIDLEIKSKVVPRGSVLCGTTFLFLGGFMKLLIQELTLFLLSFLLVFLLYQIFIVRRAKPKKMVNKKDKRIKEPKEPLEVTYLVGKGLDLKKVNYNDLLFVISIVSSIDIALVVTIIMLLKIFVLEIVVGFISTIGIILLSYQLVYLVYKKKGMVKNESKRNRK